MPFALNHGFAGSVAASTVALPIVLPAVNVEVAFPAIVVASVAGLMIPRSPLNVISAFDIGAAVLLVSVAVRFEIPPLHQLDSLLKGLDYRRL